MKTFPMPQLTPSLALLCALALPACSRHEEAPAPGGAETSAALPGGEGQAEPAPAEVHLTAQAVQSNGVKVARAQLQPLVRTLSVPARVAFNAEAVAHVGTSLHGRVSEWKVRLGDTVKKGDPLAVIDSPELGEAQADYLQKSAVAKASVAGVELAKAIWERNREVYEKTGGITLTQVQQREADYKTAVMAKQGADGAVLAAGRKLRLLGMAQAQVDALAVSGELAPWHTLVAPMAGTVVAREATLGEIVGPDRESLLVLADLGVMWVEAALPEAQCREVKVGAKAWVRMGEDDAAKEEGTVTFLAPTVDEATRTLKARIEIKGSALKPGAFVMAQLAAAGPSGPVLAIPREAVQQMEGKSVVFVPVKGEANTFALRAVILGAAVGDMLPVVSGLAAGDEFVSAGSFILKAEMLKSSAKED